MTLKDDMLEHDRQLKDDIMEMIDSSRLEKAMQIYMSSTGFKICAISLKFIDVSSTIETPAVLFNGIEIDRESV